MKKTALVALLGFALILFSCKNPKEKQNDTSTAKAELLMKAFSAEFKTAWDSGNAKALKDIFTPDGIRVLGGSQEPIVGGSAILESFTAKHAAGSPLQGSHIIITLTDARFLSEDVVIGSGTFDILNNADESLNKGKWGNTYKLINGKARMVMESAHNTGENTNNIEAVSLPEFTKDGDTSLDKIYASVARYSRFYNEKDSESLTSEFIENGVRSVSSSDGIHIGSEQIKESLMMDSDNSLQATVLGYKKLSESVAVTHGQWIEKDTEGNNVAFGQWGNVFDISGEQAQLIMESAGQFVN